MRLDKFLKVSRLIKRRTVANEACDAGRVTINDKVAKPSSKVKVGDIIEIAFGNKTVKARELMNEDKGQPALPDHNNPVFSTMITAQAAEIYPVAAAYAVIFYLSIFR